LKWSAHNGHIEIIRFLLDNGANIHADKDQALRWSVYEKHLNVIELLLERGADVHINNDELLRINGNTLSLLKNWISKNESK
jgi:ankyrin repeat protein